MITSLDHVTPGRLLAATIMQLMNALDAPVTDSDMAEWDAANPDAPSWVKGLSAAEWRRRLRGALFDVLLHHLRTAELPRAWDRAGEIELRVAAAVVADYWTGHTDSRPVVRYVESRRDFICHVHGRIGRDLLSGGALLLALTAEVACDLTDTGILDCRELSGTSLRELADGLRSIARDYDVITGDTP